MIFFLLKKNIKRAAAFATALNRSLLITNFAFASIFLLVIIRVVDAFHEDFAVVNLVRQSLLE